jgi:hypothetical protein
MYVPFWWFPGFVNVQLEERGGGVFLEEKRKVMFELKRNWLGSTSLNTIYCGWIT